MILGLRAHARVKAGDGLDVVVENLRSLVEDKLKRVPVAAEIGDEHFDAGLRGFDSDLPDGLGSDPGAAVRELVAVLFLASC